MNGYKRPTASVSNGEVAIDSNPAFTSNSEHVALLRHGTNVVLSFYDVIKTTNNSGRDYDDAMFSVISTPSGAITPGITDKNPDNTPQLTEVTYRGILLFEDIWPYRGDCDK